MFQKGFRRQRLGLAAEFFCLFFQKWMTCFVRIVEFYRKSGKKIAFVLRIC